MSNASKIRIWPSISFELHKELEEMADKERRTVHDMAAILIENSINERKRKRKNAKEDSSSDNA